MISVTCDRCGAAVDASGKIGYVAWNFRDGYDGELTGGNVFENYHFCRKCMDAVLEAVTGGKPREREGAEAGKEENASRGKDSRGQQESPPEKRGRKGADVGKIMALRKAGWPVRKIADEMGMEESSVYTAVYRHGKREKERQAEERDGKHQSGT